MSVNASSLRCCTSVRFSAGHLLYAATLTASAVSLFHWYGVPVSIFVLTIWWQILAGARREASPGSEPDHLIDVGPPARMGFARHELFIVLLIVGLLVGLLLPSHSDSDPMRHAEISMKMVARALKEYHSEYQRYPPAILFDENDQPLHSWRALILPFLDNHALADAYDFEEPWNSPGNLELAKHRPWHFREYYSCDDCENHTSECGTSMHLVTVDDLPILVELEDHSCNWLEPEEFDLEELARLRVVPDVGTGYWFKGFFSSLHRGRLAVSPSNAFQVHPSAQLSEVRECLRTEHGNKQPVEIGGARRHVHYKNIFNLMFFLAVALYPLHWLRRIHRRTE